MQSRMERLTVTNPNPVLCVEKDGTVIYSNAASEPLLHEWGVKAGVKLPSDIRDFVQRAHMQNVPEKIEVQVEKRTYLIAFHPLPEEECINMYGFDVSECKELERKLRKSEEEYRNIVETTNEHMVVIDSELRITYNGKKLMDKAGYLQEEVIGRTWLDFVAEASKDVAMEHMDQRRLGINESYELKLIRKDGSPLWVLISAKPLLDENGKFKGSLAMLTDITERKNAETKLKETLDKLEKLVKERTHELEEAYNLLKESERGLAEAQKMTHIGNWDWNLITGELYGSDEVYRIFGLNLQKFDVPFDVPFDEVLRYIHPEDRDHVNNSVKKALNGKKYDAIDFRIVLADGTERTVHAQGEVIFDEKNIPVRMRGTVQDITELKQMDEALFESEQKYRNIIETTNEGIVIIDAELRITYVNNKLIEKAGYIQEEVIGKLWCDFTDEEGKAVANLHMDKRRRGIDETYELRLINKDGSSFWVLVSSKSLFDRDGKFAGSLSMLTDITERKEAGEKIQRLANVVESSNDSITTESLDGIITSWNKGAEQVYGYLAEEVLGKNMSILEPENLKGEIKQLAVEIKRGKKIQNYETSRLKKDGTTINVSVTLSPIFDQSGKFVAISCIAGDITEKKIAEKLLQEKQMAEVANRTKSDFLAKISHELRTPLNSIIGFSDMLYEQAYGELNEKQLRSIENISKSGKHLLNLINNILDISKIEAGKMELDYKNFELTPKLNTIRNLLSPIADKKNIKIEIDTDTRLSGICADEDKFVQIMYNLLDNAVKFSYENSPVKMGAKKKGDMVEITVKDSGLGIKAEDQYKLFKPFSQVDSFFSRKSQGTGLGLSLVRQIVHLHGGYVWFRSNPGEGSIFAFAIPINNYKEIVDNAS